MDLALALAVEVSALLDMGTYNQSNATVWADTLHSHIAAVGSLSRYGMGVCPSCSKGISEEQVYDRLRLAEAAGVQEIDVWCNVNADDPDSAMWWAALRKWKAGKLPPPGPAPGPSPSPSPTPVVK